MRGRRGTAVLAAAALCAAGAGCMHQYVVPEQLARQVDRSVSFAELKRDAERHRGAAVVLGGAVLDARLLPEGTQIEVLQLPLDYADRPAGPLETSQGRFLLLDPGRWDPAVLRDRRITAVGEVLGTRVQQVDQAEYSYPSLSARFIHVWSSAPEPAYAAPYAYYPPYPHYPYAYPNPYPYSSSLYLELYPFWYVPSWYYTPYVVSTPSAPARRRFEGAPAPGVPPSLPLPSSPAPGGGGGPRRRF